MPELPEVETVCRGLKKIIGDHAVIQKVEFLRPNLRNELPEGKKTLLIGADIQVIERRAKYIVMRTSQANILSHLGMTGNWRVSGKRSLEKHDHIVISLKDGRFLIYRDPRRFGFFDIFSGESHEKLDHLGVEPLSKDFTAEMLIAKLGNRSIPLKASIMIQEVVVGVGNIYASEALFLSGISPFKESFRLKKNEAAILVKNIQQVLTKAIEAGGSTIQSFANSDGKSGYFQNQFQVYGRDGLMCLSCQQAKIKSKLIAGRSTFWCPKCQKKNLVVKLKKV